MNNETNSNELDNDNGIAIVGVSCQFPGVPDFKSFWSVLANGEETIRHFTDEELLAAGVREDRLYAKNYIKSKGILTDVENFDHELFNIEPDRALLMDPQHRVFIQKCWEALEDSGYDPHRYPGSIGLYAGCAINTYVLNNLRHADRNLTHRFNSIEYLVMTDKDFLSTQTSYLLGLTGPSVTVQTACSTSMAAIHMASESILSGESDMALAGAVTIYSPQVKGYLYEPDSIISPDGHVRSFDANGGGTVYSSGVGVVLLKRFSEAVRDNDNIYAVIRSTAINNDGNRKAQFKMPSAEGIKRVSSAALELALVPVESIGMVEANGSGTLFGDPIEVTGMAEAYSQYDLKPQSIPLGSVKSNIGHMNVTAGMGAVCKTIAALQAGQVPPSINFEKPNPSIDFSKTPFYVCDKLTPWPQIPGPRRAAVNIYGVGGTNAHAILEQAPDRTIDASQRRQHLLLLSANSENSLKQGENNLSEFLASEQQDYGSVAFTLNQGRQQLSYRSYALVGEQSLQGSLPFSLRVNTSDKTRSYLGLYLASPDAKSIQGLSDKRFQQLLAAEPELDAALAAGTADGLQNKLLSLVAGSLLGSDLLNSGIPFDCVSSENELLTLQIASVLTIEEVLELTRLAALPDNADRKNKIHALIDGRERSEAEHAIFLETLNKEIGAGDRLTAEEIYRLVVAPAVTAAPGIFFDNSWEMVTISCGHSSERVIGWDDYLTDNENTVLKLAGELWLAGHRIDLQAWYKESPRYRISLPTYAFEKNRHWIDIPVTTKASNYDVAL